MPIQPSRTSEATVDDPLPYQTPLAALVRQVGARRLAFLGIASFAVSLIATAPARIVLPPNGDGATAAVGTIWNGEVAIGEQTAVSWRLAPVRSILNLGVAADVAIRGGATDMTAKAVWRPGRLELKNVSGMAGSGLVNTLIEDLPIRCDLSFLVDLDKIVLAGPRSSVTGTVRSGAGLCWGDNGVDPERAAVPAMTGRAVTGATGTSAWLVPSDRPRGERLVQMTIDRSGRLTATVLQAGALILPAAAGQTSIETQL
jgi:hypothetical protein